MICDSSAWEHFASFIEIYRSQKKEKQDAC